MISIHLDLTPVCMLECQGNKALRPCSYRTLQEKAHFDAGFGSLYFVHYFPNIMNIGVNIMNVGVNIMNVGVNIFRHQ